MAQRPRILIADDEVRLAEVLRQGLERHGYSCSVVHDGHAALKSAGSGGFDLLLLDLMLPGLSGYRVVEELRKRDNLIPVLMLTAKDGEYDEADAFDLGVDDYVTKPFSTIVLLARINALLRRRVSDAGPITVGDLTIDARSHVCQVAGDVVGLTAREFELVQYLAEHAGAVVGKRELLDEVWGDMEIDPNAVEVCIASVRRKLGQPFITTVRGVGYRCDVPGDR